ncbi:MAG: hypothetical protein JRF17_03400 [Deltaproteobacteria bacterium]|nr:hypothetical protein [Deltaproteobacteria bacterium]
MPKIPKTLTLADSKRFRTIQDLTQMRPDCGASIDDIFVIDKEFLMIVDIYHIGDILNPYNSPSASYVRTHGVIVGGYKRDAACPVLWGDPFLLLQLSHHIKESLTSNSDIGKVVGSVSCPSGSFLLLPVREDIPTPLGSLVDDALATEDGVKIKIPNGTYRVFYEQFEAPEGSKQEFYQNIVVQKQ